MFFIKNNQKGSSLLEVLAILTIVSMLTISVMKIITNVYALLKQNMIVSEIKDVQKAISGVYNFSGNYELLFKDVDYRKILCETDKSIPNQMCIRDGDDNYSIKHRSSGLVTISPIDNYKSYSIKVEGLNKKNCIGLAEVNWVDRKRVDIYRLDINGSDVAYFPKRGNKEFPLAVTTIFEKCSENGDKNTVTLYFY